MGIRAGPGFMHTVWRPLVQAVDLRGGTLLMSHAFRETLPDIFARLQRGEISRREFLQRATAIGLAAPAAMVLARAERTVAQGATPAASPVAGGEAIPRRPGRDRNQPRQRTGRRRSGGHRHDQPRGGDRFRRPAGAGLPERNRDFVEGLRAAARAQRGKPPGQLRRRRAPPSPPMARSTPSPFARG